jgi:ribose transport system ATP-binding protein
METILNIKEISKAFPGVQALDKVSLELKKGEIHAILGENGAGKSTLMKILSGVYSKDSGEIYFDGKLTNIGSPRTAQNLGISIIHQELNLAQNIGVHQNIFMGRLPTKYWGLIDWKKLSEMSRQLLNEVQLDIDPATRIHDLTIAKQQLVEIAKALSFNLKVLIMDEPTSALNKQEVATLFKIMEKLKSQGVSIVYISHRMEEIFQVTDRITVMRDGKVIETKKTSETTNEQIVKMMTGKILNDYFAQEQPKTSFTSKQSQALLEINNISKTKLLNNVALTLHKGEVLGIAGLLGSGRTELVRAIFGADPICAGEIFIEGEKVRFKSPKDAVKHGIALLPEDRKLHGALLTMSIRDNISFMVLKKLAPRWLIKRKRQANLANEYINKLRIKTPGHYQLVKNLSGGNQQKVIIAKWLAADPKIFLLDDPTRGIDVGAKAEIYQIIKDLAAQGKGIIFISSELPEVLKVSDRVLIMREGKIIKELAKSEISEERVMMLVTGGETVH